MPIVNNVITQSAKQTWQSPDKQRTIWKIVLLINGTEPWNVETYSGEIAVPGWTGDVLSYEKPSQDPKYPPQTFVRQAPKEDGVTPGGSPAGTYMPKNKPSFDKDPKSFYYAYAKDLVVALQSTDGFTPAKLDKLVNATISAGELLYTASVSPPAINIDELISSEVDNLDDEESV